MKNLVLPLTAMAAILIFSLWAGHYVSRETASWTRLLEQSGQAADGEDWSRAEDLLSRARDGWESRKTFLHTIIEHSELNEAESLFAAAEDACLRQDAEDFVTQITLLSVRLRLLAETQTISIKNVL